MVRSRRWENENRARKVLEQQFQIMDAKERKNKPKPAEVKGPRAKFLEKYKLEGYESAKAAVNTGFDGREVFTDEILNRWIEEEK